MSFIPISIEQYIKKHLKSNPSKNEKDLKRQLKTALANYQYGVKCSCGNDIWVIGSAFSGNGCFTCITGESLPDNDFEIDLAIKKSENKKGRRHVDDIEPSQIWGFFDDDGYEINTDLIKKPSLCITCRHNNDPYQELLCQMTRYDQRNDDDFICGAFEPG